MPISKHFLKSFEQFITHYKVTGASSSYISWGKEQNHSAVCGYFGELLNLVVSNQEVFHDASIIEYLAVPINLSASTNRYLHECWNKFLIEYNSTAQMYAPIHTMDSSTPTHLQIALEGNSSERMMRDLKSALESTQKVQEFSRKAYLSEIELLKKQLKELTSENTKLSTENRLLKEQVHNDQMFRSLHPQIAKAQHQLASFADLLSNLYEISGTSPTLPSPTPPVTISSLEKEQGEITTICSSSSVREQQNDKKTTVPQNTISSPKITLDTPPPVLTNVHEVSEKDSIATQLTMSEQEKASVIKSTIPPLAPHMAPPKMASAQQHEPSHTFSGGGFFNELSKELAKRNANKQDASSTIAVDSISSGQKKSM